MITFSVNQHDKDGDEFDKCILIHFKDAVILRLEDGIELDKLIEGLQRARQEIWENYSDDDVRFADLRE